LRSRGEASIVAATRIVATCNTRAVVEVAFAGSTCGGAGTIAFATTLTATATTTAPATRSASGALAAIALGTLLLTVARRWCD